MITPDLDLDLVRCFLAVAENGGFTAASRRLNLTQSAVSLKIQRLESLLGHPVFLRTSRSVSLTTEGEILVAYGRRLLALNQEMVDRIRGTAETGRIRLGVMQQFGQQFLPVLLAEFKRSHPKVSLGVEVGMTSELLAGMEDDRYDLVLGAAGVAPAGKFDEEPVLLREKVVWAQCSGSAIDPRLNPLPLVLFPAPCGYRRAALAALEKSGRTWEVVYSSASLPSIQAAVQADLGVTVLGKSSVLPGMKVVGPKGTLPALPDTSIVIYRRKSPEASLAVSLGKFIAGAVNRMAS